MRRIFPVLTVALALAAASAATAADEFTVDARDLIWPQLRSELH